MKPALIFAEFAIALALTLQGQTQYMVVVWSSNNTGPVIRPSQTHTCAAWVKVEAGKIVDKVEINWGPTGHKPIAESIEDARSRGHQVRRWVLSCDKRFFDDAKTRRDSLKSYRLVELDGDPHTANCVGSVAGAAGEGVCRTGVLCGIPAGHEVVKHFLRLRPCKSTVAFWLANQIEEGR